MVGNTGEMDAPRAHFQEEEHVEYLQAERLDDEEIARQERVTVVLQKCMPRRRPVFLQLSERNIVTAQDVAEGRFADHHAQLFQLPV